MTVAVVAEKPSVARDLARVLGATRQGRGYLQGNGHLVTWALGHLVALAQPHEVNSAWRVWNSDLLPMFPKQWPLVVIEKTKKQFEIVKRIINSDNVRLVVSATDAGREGELIFRYIYEKAGCSKPVRRLWISSLTPEAIRSGLETLKEGAYYDDLALAAKGRSRADWLVGMNLSRAYTLAGEDTFSVGRVQTPTLALIVDRTLAIRNFVSEPYLEVEATFSPPLPEPEGGLKCYKGAYIGGDVASLSLFSKTHKKAARLAVDGEEASRIVERAGVGAARIEKIKRATERGRPPLLYDLTELQRHSNRLYGFSATKTLALAQSLYEKQKLISYPRTGSRHLSNDVAKTIGDVVEAIRHPYEELLAEGTGTRPLGKRFVDDKQVTDHHAIIPTTVPPTRLMRESDEAKIYDLVCRRLLAAWQSDYIVFVTTVMTSVTSSSDGTADEAIVDMYRSQGTSVQQLGWRALDIRFPKKKKSGKPEEVDSTQEQKLPRSLAEGQPQIVDDARAVKKRTRPPRPYTEATLLTAMETAGKTLDDKELSDAMRENGLGTPATRASIIETLLARGYLSRKGKTLEATQKGVELIETVHDHVKSPAMTGQWENRLGQIERGFGDFKKFMNDIEEFVRDVVHGVRSNISTSHLESSSTRRSALGPDSERALSGPDELSKLLCLRFGHRQFRSHQLEACRAVTRGDDVLLVMPTGAGKSLCYQLPGIARGGTTLVVSPLIALMEDQVAQLGQGGFAAERIHSGRDRAYSRRVCADYLSHKLDFLFVAPERLGVPGFLEMLAKHPPALTAVDEAHCISHWGHDFRPDYRMLKERIALLRPSPVIALTATATPLVQSDIVEQLDIPNAKRLIHGFRRTNIAIEIVEIPMSERVEAVQKILKQKGRLPAIVYAPTRKGAEQLANSLCRDFPSAAYHAGMSNEIRDQVQAAFLSSKLDAVVATIAFGMGIDKSDVRTVIHVAMPGSVEGYYQEIGRAGRDGKPSKAILMHSYVDRRTHEFFHKRDYPDAKLLEALYSCLTEERQPKASLVSELGTDEKVFNKVLEKLWIHGGARVDPEENIRIGEPHWKKPYEEQSRYKLKQLSDIARYVKTPTCRMLRLVHYFGDQEDSGNECGDCDICNPSINLLKRTRKASREEVRRADYILESLIIRNDQSKGKLYRDELQGDIKRREYEEAVDALARAKLINITEDSFEKDGRVIEFQRLHITADGYRVSRTKGELKDLLGMSLPPREKTEKKTQRKRTPRKPAGTIRRAKTKLRDASIAGADPKLARALKEWRLQIARARRIPAFRILTDATLSNIAAVCPADKEELLQVSGIGPTLLKKYGDKILLICKAKQKR